MTYKERENRLIAEMENRTEYNDGLTIPELCKRVLGYEVARLEMFFIHSYTYDAGFLLQYFIITPIITM